MKNEWSWMHSSFTRIDMNINGAIRYFARSEETEDDLDFQVANYYAGEEAKNRSRPRYQRDDRQDHVEPSIPIWDGPPPESEWVSKKAETCVVARRRGTGWLA